MISLSPISDDVQSRNNITRRPFLVDRLNCPLPGHRYSTAINPPFIKIDDLSRFIADENANRFTLSMQRLIFGFTVAVNDEEDSSSLGNRGMKKKRERREREKKRKKDDEGFKGRRSYSSIPIRPRFNHEPRARSRFRRLEIFQRAATPPEFFLSHEIYRAGLIFQLGRKNRSAADLTRSTEITRIVETPPDPCYRHDIRPRVT